MLGIPGRQCRLLGQVQRLDGRGWPAVIGLELDGQFAAADVDAGAASRPALIQPGVDSDDLPDRPLARIRVAALGEPHPQGLSEVQFEGRVIGLRGGHLGLEHTLPSIDSQRPSRVWTLLATATWVCRSGSPARCRGG